MKRLYTLVTSLLVVFFVNAQQVDRDKVVVEIVTGTWCQFCPGAAMGAEDLIANGKEVAIIEYHGGDDYQTTSGYARIQYYGVSNYPTAIFDGILSVSGGYENQSMYPQYLPKYNQRIAVPSSFTIGVEGVNSCLVHYDLTITVTKVAAVSATNMRLHVVVSESEIAENWQGMTELNWVQRLMAPNQNGTVLDFSGGDTQVLNISFTIDESWDFEQCEVAVFIQNLADKEILQGTKKMLTGFPTITVYDAAMRVVENVAEENCSGSFSPIVTIRNHTSTVMNTVDIKYEVNGGDVITSPWSGALGFLETDVVSLPEITFDVQEENQLKVYTHNPNGQTDECPESDTITMSFIQAEITTNTIYLNMRLDNKPEETTYDVRNSLGEIVYSEGPFPGEPNIFKKDTFDLSFGECYSFTIYDAGNDGMCCDNGFGFYHLQDSEGLVLQQGQTFGSMEVTHFEVMDNVSVPDLPKAGEIRIYPNPVESYANISLNLDQDDDVSIVVYNLLGKVVDRFNLGMLNAGLHDKRIDMTDYSGGIYLVRVNIGERIFTEKVSVSY